MISSSGLFSSCYVFVCFFSESYFFVSAFTLGLFRVRLVPCRVVSEGKGGVLCSSGHGHCFGLPHKKRKVNNKFAPYVLVRRCADVHVPLLPLRSCYPVRLVVVFLDERDSGGRRFSF